MATKTVTDVTADVLAEIDTLVPPDRVDVAVCDDLATLAGTLDHYYQRAAAADDARRSAGVVGVADLIVVAPRARLPSTSPTTSPGRSPAMPSWPTTARARRSPAAR